MTGGGGQTISRRPFPPLRLPAITPRAARILKPLWLAALAFALLAQLGGLAVAIRHTVAINPIFLPLGIGVAHVDDHSVRVTPYSAEARRQGVREDSRIVAVADRAVPTNASASVLAERVAAVAGSQVSLTLRDPGGALREVRLTRSPAHLDAVPVSPTTRLVVRLGFALLAAGVLIGAAVLLYLRRASDPVALALSFVFLLMAVTSDPSIQLWLTLPRNQAVELVTALWWPLLVIALAAFPTGRFVPRWGRWTVLLAVPLGLFVAFDAGLALASVFVGALVPLALLAGQIVRFRRAGPGIERQQIKWAALGFAVGLVLLMAALVLVEIGERPQWSASAKALFYLGVVCMFSLSFAIMPLGLLISLLHFRLWEADAAIGKSAGYAIVTLVVGFVWAIGADLAKALVAAVLGAENSTLSLALGALLAAGVFAPTQAVVMRWTKRRFTTGADRIATLPQRLEVWRDNETLGELGMRALGCIVDGAHALGGAIVVATPTGRELVAAQGVLDPQRLADAAGEIIDTRRFPLVLPLRDDDGLIGTLYLAPRSDANRYNRDQRTALEEIAAPLAEALRFTRIRTARETNMVQMMGELQQRLARLEGPGEQAPA